MSTEEPASGRPIAGLSVQNWVHLILAGFVVVVCGCLVVGGLVLSRISDRTTELVDHIQPARSASFQLQNSLLDQETGVRGYALTGDTTFLEPYEEGMRAERERLARLRSLTGDEQPYAGDVERIERAAQQWRTLRAEPLIAAVRENGPTAATSAPIMRSKADFDSLRALYNTQQSHLDDARDTARAELGDTRTTRDWVLVALVVGFVLAVVSLSLLLHRVVAGPSAP